MWCSCARERRYGLIRSKKQQKGGCGWAHVPEPEKTIAVCAHELVRVERVADGLGDAPSEDHARVPWADCSFVVALRDDPDHEQTAGDLDRSRGNRATDPSERGMHDLQDGQALHSGDERAEVLVSDTSATEHLADPGRLNIPVGWCEEDPERTDGRESTLQVAQRQRGGLWADEEVLDESAEDEHPAKEGDEVEDDQVEPDGGARPARLGLWLCL